MQMSRLTQQRSPQEGEAAKRHTWSAGQLSCTQFFKDRWPMLAMQLSCENGAPSAASCRDCLSEQGAYINIYKPCGPHSC